MVFDDEAADEDIDDSGRRCSNTKFELRNCIFSLAFAKGYYTCLKEKTFAKDKK